MRSQTTQMRVLLCQCLTVASTETRSSVPKDDRLQTLGGTVAENPSLNSAIGPRNTTRTIRERVARRVWVAAGGRCTFCNRWLLDDEHTGEPIFIGQLAHIVGWDTTKGSPRGSDSMDANDRNEADNLMLICYDQHRVIDSKSLWDVYSADRLREFKRQHEHQINRLTELAHRDSTTVLRLVGTIHGSPVQLSQSAVNEALVSVGQHPSYALVGTDEYEIDLRKLPGEAEDASFHWNAAVEYIRDRLRRLGALVADGTIVTIAIFPLARIPIVIALGALLDDTVPTAVYPKLRGGTEAWGWPAAGTDQDFEWSVLDSSSDAPKQATVLFSVSGSIEKDRIPAEANDGARVYEIRPAGATPNFDLVDTPASVDLFSRCWRAVIADIETFPDLGAINVIAAAPTTVAVAIGRSVNTSVHPPVRVYDRVDHHASYTFTLELPR